MKEYNILYCIIWLLILLSSCDNSSHDFLNLSPETELMANQGISFNYDGGNKIIKFHYIGSSKATVRIYYQNQQSDQWLELKEDFDRDEYVLELICAKNAEETAREAILEIEAGTNLISIKISQSPLPYSKPEIDNCIVDSYGGQRSIHINSNGNLSSQAIFDQPEWLKHKIINSNGNHILSLDIDKNDGLGRVAFIKIFVNGYLTSIISVRQKSGRLPSKLSITTSGPGQLYVLLGDDQSNFLNVRSLSISGGLNALDLLVLKRFSLNGIMGKEYPIEIDLYNSHIYRGYSCYYKDLLIELPENLPYVDDETLPLGQFEYAINLKSIILPGFLRTIEDRCFYGCKELKQIGIPDDVITIGNNVFRSCSNLKQISISSYSNLKSIGSYAFSTGTEITSLYIPAGVIDLKDSTFKNCRVAKLFVNWENPPIMECVPKGDTLIVPAGLKSKYEVTPNWNQYKNILETD